MLSANFGSNPAQPGFILILPLTSTAVEEQVVQERIALLLAVIGLYGVMPFTVEHRTKEIRIRMALGEARPQVLTRILGEALTFSPTTSPPAAPQASIQHPHCV